MRFQRIPPTEKRGRVHTSTVTVAIISTDINIDTPYDLTDDEYFRVEWFSGTGNGGQHRNKHQNSCKLYHLPTGIMESRQGRSRVNNFSDAKIAILKKLQTSKHNQTANSENTIRSKQVGTGGRDDKIRTYRFQDNTIIDHRTNKKYNLKQAFRGNFNMFWK